MKNCFIIFSDDWGVHPSSCQHLFKHIAKDNNVLWVNTIMRLPALKISEIKKIFQKVFKINRKISSDDNLILHLRTVRPFMFPIFNPFFRKINKLLLTYQLKKLLNKINFHDPVFVTTLPIAADIVSTLDVKKIIYYCVDEFSQWPGHNKKYMRDMEKLLIKSSDVVITTSKTLYDSKKDFSKKIYHLPHGADISHFKPRLNIKKTAFPHPLLGYYGLFDERNDLDLLEKILKREPNWNIIIIGEVRIDISALKKYPNIIFYGKVSYENLPDIVSNFDICSLPYLINELTVNINPLKFMEYLSTHIPIVTTALPDLKKYSPYIGWARNFNEFMKQVKKFLNENKDNRKERLEKTRLYLIDQSWEEKTGNFLKYINS
ncbi:glycosyltransferase [bacterium]|nr:glycosyltransferase [bacterium]